MNKKRINLAIIRSEKAYRYYLKDKLYFQALRIYKANEILYNLLQEYQLNCSNEEQEKICNYIFHLEDWMLQFEDNKIKVKSPIEIFIFERWKESIPFQNI